MRRKRRNHQRTRPGTPKVCACGAQIEGKGDLCRKCRGRLRWIRRTKGRRRDQWRDLNRSQLSREVVSTS